MKSALLFGILWIAAMEAHADEFRLLVDLRGTWGFELGDKTAWSARDFDDSGWDQIYAPSPWEDQGYPGYDGFAWYRKHFRVSRDWTGKYLYVDLGNIDDVSEIYINGHFVAFEGSFPPHYRTAYNIGRKYCFPASLLDTQNDNVIAVRVYDSELSGGIIRGALGIYEQSDALQPDVMIAGTWKFKTGDDLEWKRPDFDDAQWASILVPAFWETQGYPDYDGFAWYRTRFRLPPDMAGKKLILLVGRIDDFDETYLNGEEVGHTGSMRGVEGTFFQSDEYSRLRAYTVSPDRLSPDGDNVLAVRVYDGFMHGGIYDTPVGLVTREHYLKWKDHQTETKTALQRFLEYFFK